MNGNREIYDFYENGAEIGRLERGIGKLEAMRTKELLLRWLPNSCTIYDIGGGIGYYADWLAGMGHTVTMLELAPSAVEYAKKTSNSSLYYPGRRCSKTGCFSRCQRGCSIIIGATLPPAKPRR